MNRVIAIAILSVLAIPLGVGAQVAGSGSANRIPIWKNSTTLGNSNLFQTGGEVGIGTTTPAATLDVKGSNGSGTQSAPVAFKVNGGVGGNLPLGAFGSAGSGGGLQLVAGTGGFAGFASLASGGTGAAILITGGTGGSCFAASTRCAFVRGNGGSIALQPGTGGRPGNVGLAPNGGRIGVGTMNPTATFEVVAGATTLADSWTTRSSRRFKTNIRPLEGALEKIAQLQGVYYERESDGKHEIGVVAEDVVNVVPEVVSRNPQTKEIQGVDYSRLAAVLIEAIKSQQAELQAQQLEIQQLKGRMECLGGPSGGAVSARDNGDVSPKMISGPSDGN